MTVRILILGTGGMAGSHAEAFAEIDGAEVVAGVDMRAENLAAFQEKFGVAHGFTTLEDALAWGEFDAACNVTPDAVHHRTTLPLLAAGKHVLCEKPLAANQADADEMAQAAAEAGVVHMVNLTYRNVAALIKAQELIAAGDIGDVRHFEASYLQSWLTQPAWGEWSTEDQWLWRLSTAHGSMGVLGDVGVHILDFATFAAGLDATDVSCRLATFDKAPGGRIGEYTLDANDSFTMTLGLAGGATGVVHASRFATGHLNDLNLRIYGTKGGIEVTSRMHSSHLRVCLSPSLETAEWRDIDAPLVPTNYARFVDAVARGRQVHPDFHRGAALQRVLDLAVASDAANCANQRI